MTGDQVADLLSRARLGTTAGAIEGGRKNRDHRRRLTMLEVVDDATHQAMEAIERLPYLAPYGQR
jgi:hypothetical protein